MDDLLAELSAEGWLVSTLAQHDDGTWVANLRKPVDGGDLLTEWARGPTAAIALELAMTKIGEAEYAANAAQAYSAAPPPGEGVLSRLGLTQRLAPIRRI
jgi:hypothetical protein